jgi:hypothetical protein
VVRDEKNEKKRIKVVKEKEGRKDGKIKVKNGTKIRAKWEGIVFGPTYCLHSLKSEAPGRET